jgi:FkbM family methyltransferase
MDRLLVKYGYYLGSIFKLLVGFHNPLFILKIFFFHPNGKQALVKLRSSKLVFYVRGVMDVWSIKETFIDRFYERFGSRIGSNWTIIDIGGGIGDFTLFAAVSCPNNRVLAFEPYAESYDMLLRNVNRNDIKNVEAYPLAVAGVSGVVNLDISGGEPLQVQSVMETTTNYSFTVPSISLEDIFNQYHLSHCDLLKLDCEGGEYPILLNTPSSLFSRIKRIVMEYHKPLSSQQHLTLVDYLEKAGYEIQVTQNYVHHDLGYLYAFKPR